MIKALARLTVSVLMGTSAAQAAAPDQATLVFCARAAVITEAVTESMSRGQSLQESIPPAVAATNTVFKGKIDDTALQLLMPWIRLSEKLPGYQPYTKGSYIAVSCVAALHESKFVPYQQPDVMAQVKKLLDTCEAKGARDVVGQCIKQGFASLPLEQTAK